MAGEWDVVGRAPLAPTAPAGGDEWAVVGRAPIAPAAAAVAPARREVGFGEASTRAAEGRVLGYGRSVAESLTGGPGATAIGVLVDRARGVAPGTSVQEARDFFGAPAREAAINPQTEQLTSGGKLGSAVGTLAVDIPMALATAPTGVAQLFTAGTPAQVARQLTQAEFTRGVGAMAVPGVQSGIDRARELQAQGASPVAAALGGATTAGTTMASGGVAATVPSAAATAVGRGLQRAVVGAPAAIVTNEITRQADNTAAAAAGLPTAQRPFSVEDALIEAVPQTVLAAFLGGRYSRAPDRVALGYPTPEAARAEEARVQARAEAFTTAQQNPQLRALFEANNITSPDDPRIEAAATRLVERQKREAAAATERATVGPNADPERVAAARDAIAAGEMNPAAAPWAGRQPTPPLPPVIELGTERVSGYAPGGAAEITRSNVGEPGTAEGIRTNVVEPARAAEEGAADAFRVADIMARRTDDLEAQRAEAAARDPAAPAAESQRIARAYAEQGIDPGAAARDFELARTRAARPDDVRRLRGQSALSDTDAAAAARSAGLAVEDVRMLSPEGQQRLLEKARREEAAQRQGDAAGPLASSDTGSPDGMSSPASRPNVPGDRMPQRGQAEDRTARASLSDAEVADLRRRYTDEAAFRREVQAATKRREADMQRLDAARAQRDALDRSDELAGLRRRRDTVADLSTKEQARLDALEAQRTKLNDSIFNLEERIYRAEDPANLGSRSASGVGDRPFRTRGDGAEDGIGGNEGQYRARAEADARRARQEEIDRLEREWAERQQMRDAADAQRRQQEGARQAEQGRDEAGRRAREERAGERAAPADEKTGRYAVDERGFVVSDRGGPVWFNHQRDAARWILTVGNRARGGQVWQIANHPDRRGFTVEQTRVNEPPPGGGKDAPKGENQAKPADKPPSLGAGTLSANPFADPRLLKELASDIGGGIKKIVQALRNTFGWADREAQGWSDHLHDTMKFFSRRTKPGDGDVGLAKLLLLSNDGVRRTLAARFNSDAITKVADLFFAPGGGDRAIGQSYHEAIADVSSRRLNQLREVLAPLYKMPAAQRDEALAAVGRLLAGNGRIERGTPIGDAAIGVRAMLREMHAYAKEAGLDLGEVKTNYFPRVEDTNAILADQGGFLKAAKRAYEANGLPSDAAARMAEEWLQRVMLGDLGVRADGNDFVAIGAGIGDSKPTKGRVLGPAADKIMDAFYLRDPQQVLTRYVLGMAQRAEWNRRMGVDAREAKPGVEQRSKWDAMKADIIKQGAGAALPDIVKSIQSETGMMGGAGSAVRGVVSGLHLWQSLSFLDRATVASVVEPIVAGIRTGNAGDSLRALGKTVKQWVPMLRSMKDAEKRALAEDLGLIVSAMDNGIMGARFGSEMNGEFGRYVQTQFFQKTGLQQLTDATRIASMDIGQTFIRRLANEPDSAKAKVLMRELGIADADQAAFAKFVRGLDGKADFAAALKGKEGEQYRAALRRFVEQTVMNPNGAHKPRYANHPLGSLAYGLMGYLFAFQKNVVQRSYRVAKQARATGDASLLAPMAMLPALVPVAYAMGELRQFLFADPANRDRPEPEWYTKLMTAVSRSGLLGVLDMPLNAVLGVRYDKDPATVALGPLPGALSSFFSQVVNLATDKNAEGTNTQERRAARAAYDLVLSPIANAGASVIPATPAGTALGAAVIYSGTMPAAREGFVRAVAGPPKERKGSSGGGLKGSGGLQGTGGLRGSGGLQGTAR